MGFKQEQRNAWNWNYGFVKGNKNLKLGWHSINESQLKFSLIKQP